MSSTVGPGRPQSKRGRRPCRRRSRPATTSTLPPRPAQEPGHPAAHLVHARLGVAAAVDVDQGSQVDQEVGQERVDGGADAGELGCGQQVGHAPKSTDATVPGPCPGVGPLSSADDATRGDPAARRPQPVPPGADREGRAGRGPPAHVVRRPDAGGARPGPAGRAGPPGGRRRSRSRTWRRGSAAPPADRRGRAGWPPRDAPRAGIPVTDPSHVGARALGGRVPVAGGGSRGAHRGGRRRARRSATWTRGARAARQPDAGAGARGDRAGAGTRRTAPGSATRTGRCRWSASAARTARRPRPA